MENVSYQDCSNFVINDDRIYLLIYGYEFMPEEYTFVQAAEIILRKIGRSMKAEEIVTEAVRQGLLVTKSVDTAATMRYSLDEIYRNGHADDSNLVKIGPNLWSLKEIINGRNAEHHLKEFTVGGVYSRKQIAAYFKTNDASIRNGVFRPKGLNEVLLFVTENKEKFQTPYKDQLVGEVLEWDGQKEGRTDYLVKGHKNLGLTLLVFYRKSKRALSDYSFEFLGTATYLDSRGKKPTHFWLQLDSFQNSQNEETVARTYTEGKRKTMTCSTFERDPIARAEAIRIHGLTCEVCGFNFEDFYGSRGRGYVEVHHRVPLSETQAERETDPGSDLTILCSNCHRMVHRIRENPILPEELRSMIDNRA